MLARKRETGSTVVECCTGPVDSRMTLRTRMGESCTHVVRVGRAVEVRSVARVAVCRSIRYGSLVTRLARDCRMCARKVENRRRVVKRGRSKGRRGGMTIKASVLDACGGMVDRRNGIAVIGTVARITFGGSVRVPRRMALRTLEIRVLAC